MDWVKLSTAYFRDYAITTGDDALEVMFTRGLAYCGEAETSGFIPAIVLPTLTRRPVTAAKTAAKLVQAGLWDRSQQGGVRGFQVVNWHQHQRDLEKYVEKKKREAARKRKSRANDSSDGEMSADVSADAGADKAAPNPQTSMSGEVEVEKETAAAAAVPERSGGGTPPADGKVAERDLPAAVAILAGKLRAWTPLRALRFDALTPAQVGQLERLIAVHGDDPLVAVVKQTAKAQPPVLVNAFLGTWAAMPAPGQVLAAVEARCHHCGKGEKACKAANRVVAADDRHEFEEAAS